MHARRGRPDADAVFVDTSGRRRRVFVTAGIAGATVLILLAVALLAGLTGVGPAEVPGWPGSGQHEAQGPSGAPNGSPDAAGQPAPSATPNAPSPAASPGASAAAAPSGSASPSPSKRHGPPSRQASTHPSKK